METRPPWADLIYDRYSRIMGGEPVRGNNYQAVEEPLAVQILEYETLDEGKDYTTFFSFGMSRYPALTGSMVELMVDINSTDERICGLVRDVFRYCVFTCLRAPVVVAPGKAMRFNRFFPEFFEATGKSSLLIELPNSLTPKAACIRSGNEAVHLFMGYFLSEGEWELLNRAGIKELHEKFWEFDIKASDLFRPSTC